MTASRYTVSTRSRRARSKRRGAALLIVLFVLMMATGTAVYAMQSTQFEQRAAGSLQQAMRAKYIAEAATHGVLAVCLERGAVGCADGLADLTSFTPDQRVKYGLPDRGTLEKVSSLSRADLTGPAFRAPVDTVGQTPADVFLPTDGMLIDDATPNSAIASAYRPDFVTSVEKWAPSSGSDTNNQNEKYRLVISTYGALSYPSDAGVASQRGNFESISATRAFFDVR